MHEADSQVVLVQMIAGVSNEVSKLREEVAEERRIATSNFERLMANGCAKAGDHAEIAKQGERITLLELARARNLGIASVLMIGLGAVITLADRKSVV
jgi:hypothetical protein